MKWSERAKVNLGVAIGTVTAGAIWSIVSGRWAPFVVSVAAILIQGPAATRSNARMRRELNESAFGLMTVSYRRIRRRCDEFKYFYDYQ